MNVGRNYQEVDNPANYPSEEDDFPAVLQLRLETLDNPEVEVYFGWQEETATGGITHDEWIVKVGGELGIASADPKEVIEYIEKLL